MGWLRFFRIELAVFGFWCGRRKHRVSIKVLEVRELFREVRVGLNYEVGSGRWPVVFSEFRVD